MSERDNARYDEPAVPHHWYPPDATVPTLCEIRGEWVYLFDSDRARHRSKFQGRFVRLIEAQEVTG